jgi:RNA polymerase sigma-70 factor (ECF subfamily)
MYAQVAPPSAVEPTDVDVIADVLAGKPQSFGVLVQRHNQPVFRACRAVLRNDQDAEDATQTAWLSAYRALAHFRADASFRTWVTRIAVNEATSRIRQQQRRLAALPPHEREVTATLPSDSPEREVLGKELARLLEREIDALPEGLRSVLVLRDIVELDTAETATSLGIEPENVRVRLHRARQTLALRLSAMDDLLAAAMPDVWRFDGDRCARMLARVMAAITQP